MDNALILEIITYLPVIPAAIMCLLPMHNQLKCNMPMAIFRVLLFLAIVLPAASYLNIRFSLDENALTLPIILLTFIVYRLHTRASLASCIAIMSFVCSLMCILSNFATLYDALLRPDAAANTFGLEAALFQLTISAGVLILLSWFLWNFGSELVDSLENDGIWYTTTLTSLIFVSLNITLYPSDYSVLQSPGAFTILLVELSLLMALLLLSAGMFYYTVSEILDKHRMEERNRMLEVRESQYKSQQSYLEATARARHDFRQTIRTMKELADQGNYKELSDYLDDYVKSMPSNTIVKYCHNNAVNALLNYYTRDAERLGIELNLSADLPESISVSDVDLCSILGNILENAMTATRTMPEGKRWIDLVVATQLDSQLIIVATNSHAGNIRMRDGEYQSTTHRGKGVGLQSIRTVAERNGGIAEFSHTADEFRTDVMIPLH